ncbi:MAG: type II secretion system protein M [Alphaproteobacteria bacterium]|nr:MAG: type II secretion system protein M [Alphaproteobacteria bacterium]
MERWQSLTAREQGLILIAGGLTALMLVWLVLVRPVAAYRADSERSLTAARATYEQVAAGAALVEAYRAGGSTATRSDQPLRVLVATAARDAGVSISRLQPGEDGALGVWVDSVASPALYGWLHALAEQHNVAPAKVFIQKSGTSGMLRVQVQFAGGGA